MGYLTLKFTLTYATLAALALFSAFQVQIAESNTRVDIKLAVSGVPNMDPFNGYPDPFAAVSYSYSQSDEYLLIGETEYCDDVNSCEWAEEFTFDYVAGANSTQRVKVEVWDWDFDSNDYVGYAEVFLADIVNAVGNVVEGDLIPAGMGNLTIKAVVNGTGVQSGQADKDQEVNGAGCEKEQKL